MGRLAPSARRVGRRGRALRRRDSAAGGAHQRRRAPSAHPLHQRVWDRAPHHRCGACGPGGARRRGSAGQRLCSDLRRQVERRRPGGRADPQRSGGFAPARPLQVVHQPLPAGARGDLHQPWLGSTARVVHSGQCRGRRHSARQCRASAGAGPDLGGGGAFRLHRPPPSSRSATPSPTAPARPRTPTAAGRTSWRSASPSAAGRPSTSPTRASTATGC